MTWNELRNDLFVNQNFLQWEKCLLNLQSAAATPIANADAWWKWFSDHQRQSNTPALIATPNLEQCSGYTLSLSKVLQEGFVGQVVDNFVIQESLAILECEWLREI